MRRLLAIGLVALACSDAERVEFGSYALTWDTEPPNEIDPPGSTWDRLTIEDVPCTPDYCLVPVYMTGTANITGAECERGDCLGCGTILGEYGPSEPFDICSNDGVLTGEIVFTEFGSAHRFTAVPL